MTTSGLTLTGVKYLLAAQDMDRAVAFWRDALGFAPRISGEHWSELAAHGAVIALHGGHDGSRNPTGLSLDVADIHAAAAAIRAAGGEVVTAPHEGNPPGLWLADVADAEGNVFMLAQDTRAGD